MNQINGCVVLDADAKIIIISSCFFSIQNSELNTFISQVSISLDILDESPKYG